MLSFRIAMGLRLSQPSPLFPSSILYSLRFYFIPKQKKEFELNAEG